MATAQDWTSSGSAIMAGGVASFSPSYREFNDTPASFEVTLRVPVSIEDAAAVFWMAVNGGLTFDELDDDCARKLLAEALIANSGEEMAEARSSLTAVRPGTPEHVIAAEVLRRARELFAPTGPTRRPVCSTPRELVPAGQ